MPGIAVHLGAADNIYPEREDIQLGKLDQWVSSAWGKYISLARPRSGRFKGIVDAVNAQSPALKDLSDKKILELSRDLKPQLRRKGFTRDLTARVFALVRETASRAVGLRHFDVQIIGGMVLLNGMVAEMETGEGKTLAATLPACAAALAGIPVHIITVNDYLAQRDAEWMGPIYKALGLSVGTIVHEVEPAARREVYQSDVTYCTNKEVAFDYLRDRLVLRDRPTSLRLQAERLFGGSSRANQLLLRGLHFAIVDEVDSVLIDEARTPLIISTEADDIYDPEVYRHVMGLAEIFKEKEDYDISFGDRTIRLTPLGRGKIGGFNWEETGSQDGEKPRDELFQQALVALHLFDRDKHYLVKDGKVQIIDEYTGRLMADRSWEGGLHQFVEVKEDCEVTTRKETRARISYQRFFRRYLRLAGMTGTAREVTRELGSIYGLRIVTIPPNRPMNRTYLPDRAYSSSEKRWEAVVKTISETHKKARPVLVGTRSVEASEHLSGLMEQAGLPHKVLNARQNREEAETIARAGQKGQITVATNMAGRGTDIQLGPGVSEMGGLHVIATERHEARRIDRQLFGRCGRQGDLGSCEAIISFDDDLITSHAGKIAAWIGVLYAKRPRNFLARWTVKIIFTRAQLSSERTHARMRRDLLRMDEHLDQLLAFTGNRE